MISSGIFVLPAVAFRMTGPSMIAAYLVAALFMIPSALVKAELATSMPISGLTFYSVFRSLGPYFGCVCGFASWLSITFKTAFAAMGLGGIYTAFNPNASDQAISAVAIGFMTILVLINVFTVKGTKALQKLFVTGLLIVLSIFGVVGLKELPDNGANFTPFLAKGWPAFFTTVGTVSVTFGGLTKVVAVSEEIKNPRKNIPKPLFLSFFSMLLLYVLLLVVVITSLSAEELTSSYTPIADAAKNAFGKSVSIFINFSSIIAYFCACNSGLLSAARSPVAMSRDNILPKFFGYTSAKFKTPITGLLATYSGFAVYQPSIKTFAFPYLNVAGIVVSLFLLIDMGSVSYLSISGMLAILVVWHFAYVRRRTGDAESILAFLNSHPSSTSRSVVEDELLAIKTSDLEPDHFDEIAERSLVIDSTATSSREAFNECANAIEERFNLDSVKICNILVESEFKGGFDIAPNVAIFNVAISNKDDALELLIFRSKAGVEFYDGSVCKLIYVFISSREFSNNFLQCLNSLCKSVARKDFLQQALVVRSKRNLQELFFVCARKRHYYAGTNDVILEASPVRRNSIIETYSRSNSVSSFKQMNSGGDRKLGDRELPSLVEDADEFGNHV
ncbi:hypothetical protein GEMRC1_011817 [Eukaryota sp. GEM-RC1]